MRWVVVGAGSAGCVAARRLHDAGHDVVVVEAGPPLARGDVPPSIDGDDSFAAIGEPGRIHAELSARRVAGVDPSQYLRGRGVGGSSAVNFMVALRGDDRLYRSWGWDDADEAFDRVLVPVDIPEPHELGRVDRLLLAAEPSAEVIGLTRHGGRRVTAAEAYIWPCATSPRFSILTDRHVDRVRMDAAGCATGVVLADGTVIDADHVAVTAGSIHSPAVLLRSGLDDSGIGSGLADHPAVGFTLELIDEWTVPDDSHRGLVTSALASIDPLQLLPLNHLGRDAPGNLAMLLVALMRPEGVTGSVALGSDDPLVEPTVDFDLLSHPSDLARLRTGVREVIEVLARPPFAGAISRVFIDDLGTTIDALDSDDAIDGWMRRRAADYVHATSSCAAAVDDNGCVAEGLYVWDASVFPGIPNVNTHLPTMMLAERLSARWIHMAGSQP